jgi:limonene-1,2-epoxide hydrolase
MATVMAAHDVFQRYLDLFETLTPERLDDFDEVTSEDIRFTDPFSDVVGRDGFKRVLRKMFDDVARPQFTVLDVAASGHSRYVRWRFAGQGKSRPRSPLVIEGMSEITLDADGRVVSHRDYWDAASQVYERLPILGALLRLMKRRIGVSH